MLYEIFTRDAHLLRVDACSLRNLGNLGFSVQNSLGVQTTDSDAVTLHAVTDEYTSAFLWQGHL